MKNKLLLIASGIFLFASCSDMRYAGMQKVKHNPKSVVEAKNNPEKKSSPEKIEPIDAIQSGPLVWAETPTPVQIENNQTEKIEKHTVSPKIAKITKKVFPRIAEKIQKQKEESKISERKSIEKKQTVQETKLDKGSWLWYVVVGLIFLLLAAIIGYGVGNILYIVGVILIIYGLLVLLGVF